MTTGVCPQCNSKTVYAKYGGVCFGQEGTFYVNDLESNMFPTFVHLVVILKITLLNKINYK